MSFSLKSLKVALWGNIWGSIVGGIKRDTRSSGYNSYPKAPYLMCVGSFFVHEQSLVSKREIIRVFCRVGGVGHSAEA